MKKLNLNEVEDKIIRENFRAVQDSDLGNVFRGGNFRFVEWRIAAGTIAYPHGLDYIPKDVIQLSVIPAAGNAQTSVNFNYALFNKETITIIATVACTLRAFIGSYREGEK